MSDNAKNLEWANKFIKNYENHRETCKINNLSYENYFFIRVSLSDHGMFFVTFALNLRNTYPIGNYASIVEGNLNHGAFIEKFGLAFSQMKNKTELCIKTLKLNDLNGKMNITLTLNKIKIKF